MYMEGKIWNDISSEIIQSTYSTLCNVHTGYVWEFNAILRSFGAFPTSGNLLYENALSWSKTWSNFGLPCPSNAYMYTVYTYPRNVQGITSLKMACNSKMGGHIIVKPTDIWDSGGHQ